jgi:two-component system C4-dicarboxylate transport response regulator DctD
VSKHVLLLDDDPTQLKIRETILRSAGILVSIATTPESALALMRSQLGHYGAVVTDHLLKGQTGADFVRELRSFNTEIPVLVLSGMAEIEEEYQGMNAKIRQKPLPPEELIQLVQEAIN